MGRDKRLRIMLTEEEERDIRQAADNAGLPPATWVRLVSLAAARAIPTGLAELIRSASRIEQGD